jgi:hypothetical protein
MHGRIAKMDSTTVAMLENSIGKIKPTLSTGPRDDQTGSASGIGLPMIMM